jgi:GGDEF domain-containing protein
VLEELVRALGGVLRVGDLAYRIGEDEFALLLPATDGAALTTIHQRLASAAAGVAARLGLPAAAPELSLRTAPVKLEGVVAGGQILDAAGRALDLDRQKVRWTPTP